MRLPQSQPDLTELADQRGQEAQFWLLPSFCEVTWKGTGVGEACYGTFVKKDAELEEKQSP